MKRRRMLAAVVASLAATACAPATEQAIDGPSRSGTMLVVQNQNWMEVAIYVQRGSGQRARLGSVPSMGKVEFPIPRTYVIGVSDIIVHADPIGSRNSYVSPPIQVFPGARLALTVANQLRHSSFAVYGTN